RLFLPDNYNKDMRFLSNVLAVIVGLLLFFVVGFFMLAAIVAVSGGSKVETVENSMLHLNLENVMLVERDIDDDFDLVAMGSFGNIPTVGLNQLKKAITTAKNDDNIKGIYLQ